MANRLYEEAFSWVESRFSPDAKLVRPTLTIHVGESCPDSEVNGECLSPASRELYLPKWDRTSPGAIIQGAIVASMMQLIKQQNIRAVAQGLLAGDAGNFVSAGMMKHRNGD